MKNNEEKPIHNSNPMIGQLIFDRYKLIKKLGEGSFGSIYMAEYNNQYYAIKLEERKMGHNLLENEAYIMGHLRGPGLPLVKSYGYSNKHNILVMELMGKSLEDIFERFEEKKMSIRCVCNIGYQMIEILEYIHNKHYIHRDIKPDNFVIGRKEKRKYIYILDFGLSKKYRSSKTLAHYKMVKKNNLTGTARYASINALNGFTQSRRDDLEAVGYVLMYFLRGKLPWQGIPVQNKEMRYKKIMEKKMSTSPEELCEGFPNQFTEYIKYTRNLKYEENPDYDYLKNLFVSMLNSDGFEVDCYYDWDKETIKYFRDFKNEDNKNGNNNNINDISSPNTNKQINSKDVNMYASNENKKYIRFSNYNTSKTNQENNNNISLANNLGNTIGGVNGSSANIESPSFNHKQNSQYITTGKENTNQIQDNNMENAGLRYNSENKENMNSVNKLEINQKNNFDDNNVSTDIGQNKLGGKRMRSEKDDKCCLIF